MKKKKFVLSAIVVISAVAILFLTWLIFLKEEVSSSHVSSVEHLPFVNCCLNLLSSLFIISGVVFIKRRAFFSHGVSMILAMIFSILFFVSYSIYHYYVGDKYFTGVGWIRPLYFFILISHILVTVFTLPMILWTFSLAAMRSWERHRFWAKRTVPFWLYISVTGVLIYIFLYVLT